MTRGKYLHHHVCNVAIKCCIQIIICIELRRKRTKMFSIPMVRRTYTFVTFLISIMMTKKLRNAANGQLIIVRGLRDISCTNQYKLQICSRYNPGHALMMCKGCTVTLQGNLCGQIQYGHQLRRI